MPRAKTIAWALAAAGLALLAYQLSQRARPIPHIVTATEETIEQTSRATSPQLDAAIDRHETSPSQQAKADWPGFVQGLLALADDEERRDILNRTFADWAREEPAEALMLLETFADLPSGDQVFNAILLDWAIRDPKPAADYARTSPWANTGIVISILERLYQKDPDAALAFLAKDSPTLELNQVAASLVHQIASDDPLSALDLASSLSGKYADPQLVAFTLRESLDRHRELDLAWAETYLAQSGFPKGKDAYVLLLASQDPQQAAIRAQAEASALSPDTWPQLISEWAGRDPQAAGAFASDMQDEALKSRSAEIVFNRWRMSDPEAATNWARRHGYDF